MDKFDSMTYSDFVGNHGGRRTKALAGRFRQRKGLSITPEMDNAIMSEAARRAVSMANRQEAGTANSPNLSVDGGLTPGKPLPGVNNKMLGAPDAPRIGGRTSPGTTPRAKSNMPGGDNWPTNPNDVSWVQPGTQKQHAGPNDPLGMMGSDPRYKDPNDPLGMMGSGRPQTKLGPAIAWNGSGQRVNPLKSVIAGRKPSAPKSRRGNVQRQH